VCANASAMISFSRGWSRASSAFSEATFWGVGGAKATAPRRSSRNRC
jgi:hypothetical protein